MNSLVAVQCRVISPEITYTPTVKMNSVGWIYLYLYFLYLQVFVCIFTYAYIHVMCVSVFVCVCKTVIIKERKAVHFRVKGPIGQYMT